LLFSAMGSSIRLGHNLDDRWYDCLPLHHIGGISILFRCAWLGTTVILDNNFDASRTNEWIDRGSATQLSLVPTMLEELLDERQERPFPASLRFILLGGSPAAPALVARAKEINAPLSLTWGMTETASQVATCFPGLTPPWVGQGPPLPFARVENQAGALVVHGPIAGKDPIQTPDRGFVDVRGCVHVEGRADQVFISGGKNIDPHEIEQILEQHKDVQGACVIGVGDDRWGARPWAIFEAEDGVDADLSEELRTWCRTTLSGYKVPDRFIQIDALPRSSIGKVLRARVAELVALREQIQPVQPLENTLGHGALAEGAEIDDRMNQPSGGLKVAFGATDPVREGYGAVADALYGQGDREPVPHAHGALEVGLGVNQGHTPSLVVEDRGQVVLGRGEHLLEGHMAILEHPAKKGDPGSIDLVKADGNFTKKSHLKNPVSDWEKA